MTYFEEFRSQSCIAAVAEMRTPIVGAINGATFTGGLEMALGCDFLIASERAVFADTHARVGILPGGGMTARLPQVVGAAMARRLSMTGEVVDAARAERIGLVTEVVRARPAARTGPSNSPRQIAEVPGPTCGPQGDLRDAARRRSSTRAGRRGRHRRRAGARPGRARRPVPRGDRAEQESDRPATSARHDSTQNELHRAVGRRTSRAGGVAASTCVRACSTTGVSGSSTEQIALVGGQRGHRASTKPSTASPWVASGPFSNNHRGRVGRASRKPRRRHWRTRCGRAGWARPGAHCAPL